MAYSVEYDTSKFKQINLYHSYSFSSQINSIQFNSVFYSHLFETHFNIVVYASVKCTKYLNEERLEWNQKGIINPAEVNSSVLQCYTVTHLSIQTKFL